MQSAGWQCAGVTAGSKCTYVVGDVATSASGAVDFPVDVAESAPLNTPITLNVVGTDQDGNAFSGGMQGVDHEVTISAVNLYLPYIGKNWSK